MYVLLGPKHNWRNFFLSYFYLATYTIMYTYVLYMAAKIISFEDTYLF